MNPNNTYLYFLKVTLKSLVNQQYVAVNVIDGTAVASGNHPVLYVGLNLIFLFISFIFNSYISFRSRIWIYLKQRSLLFLNLMIESLKNKLCLDKLYVFKLLMDTFLLLKEMESLGSKKIRDMMMVQQVLRD